MKTLGILVLASAMVSVSGYALGMTFGWTGVLLSLPISFCVGVGATKVFE